MSLMTSLLKSLLLSRILSCIRLFNISFGEPTLLISFEMGNVSKPLRHGKWRPLHRLEERSDLEVLIMKQK
ncbi:hypothetical protein DAI22_06g162303 [Oryza sativa Japonica Group]|nr:hypothetical protein DAI22_06g162303 [Oryza sativa Japonica Group]